MTPLTATQLPNGASVDVTNALAVAPSIKTPLSLRFSSRSCDGGAGVAGGAATATAFRPRENSGRREMLFSIPVRERGSAVTAEVARVPNHAGTLMVETSTDNTASIVTASTRPT